MVMNDGRRSRCLAHGKRDPLEWIETHRLIASLAPRSLQAGPQCNMNFTDGLRVRPNYYLNFGAVIPGAMVL